MRLERITPGRRAPARLVGAVLARDLTIADDRWSKGRRLSADDLHVLASADHGPPVTRPRPRSRGIARGRCRPAARDGGGRLRPDGPWSGPEPGGPAGRPSRRAQRPDRRARAGQPDRSARGVHRVRWPGRRQGRPGGQREGRAPPGRRGDGRRGRPRGPLRRPSARVGRPVHPGPGRGHRQGVAPGRRPASVRGERPGEGARAWDPRSSRSITSRTRSRPSRRRSRRSPSRPTPWNSS